jgi:two-component system, NarL family, response regulator LiaR
MEMELIRVLVVDDHNIVLQGIQVLLEKIDGIEVVGLASNGKTAIELYKTLKPDVILMDLVMPEMDGIDTINQIIADYPDAKILVLTSFITDDKVFPAIKAGAMGYLLKDSYPMDLVRSIHQVYHGEPSLHPSIARKILTELKQPSSETEMTQEPLTSRELEILQLLAKGDENHEIAEKLVIAEVTVRTHISRIFRKLHLANRVQASLYALRKGYINIDDE